MLLATVFVVLNDWRVNDLVFVRGLLKRFAVSHRSNWNLEKLEDHGILLTMCFLFFLSSFNVPGSLNYPLKRGIKECKSTSRISLKYFPSNDGIVWAGNIKTPVQCHSILYTCWPWIWDLPGQRNCVSQEIFWGKPVGITSTCWLLVYVYVCLSIFVLLFGQRLVFFLFLVHSSKVQRVWKSSRLTTKLDKISTEILLQRSTMRFITI